MRSVYDRCCSYAWKCSPWLYKDIVHNAWLANYEKDGSNLFDKHIGYALRFIRWSWFNEVRKGKYSVGGKDEKRELFQRVFIDANEIILSSQTTASDQQLITKEFYEELYRRISKYSSGHPLHCSIDPETLKTFVYLVDQGYSIPEIAGSLKVTRQAVHYYKKKVRSIIESMQDIQNPFNGNKAKLTKKITRSQYEQKYKDTYVYDPEKGDWCDRNETSEILVHKETGEYILVKNKND